MNLDVGMCDAEAIARVLAGEVDSFGVLLNRYRDSYTRYAVRMLGDREDADDALQSAFVRAFRKLDECRDPERFGAWLHQIVRNECHTLALRRARRERRIVRDPEGLEQAGDGGGAWSEFGLREEIDRALARLDPDHREAFLLKHVEEMSYDEMAALTGVGVSALKMRVKRACDHLRQMLEGVTV